MKISLLTLTIIGLNFLVGAAHSDEAASRKVDKKEYLQGQTDARGDLKQGKIEYKIVGQPSMIDQDLRKVALKDYGIVVGFHGCVRGPRIDYDQGYLDTVAGYLKKKYSFDPVLKIEHELRTKKGERDSADQPATAPVSKLEGHQHPNPEPGVRPE